MEESQNPIDLFFTVLTAVDNHCRKNKWFLRIYLIGSAGIMANGLPLRPTKDIDGFIELDPKSKVKPGKSELMLMVSSIKEIHGDVFDFGVDRKLEVVTKFVIPLTDDMIKTSVKLNSFANRKFKFSNISVYTLALKYLVILKTERMHDQDLEDIQLIFRRNEFTLEELDESFKQVVGILQEGGDWETIQKIKENYEVWIQQFLWKKHSRINGIIQDIEQNRLRVYLHGEKEMLKWHYPEKTKKIKRLVRDIKELFPYLKFAKLSDKDFLKKMCNTLLKLFDDYRNNRETEVTDDKINEALDRITEAFK